MVMMYRAGDRHHSVPGTGDTAGQGRLPCCRRLLAGGDDVARAGGLWCVL